jgi:glycosyltransferase involved in cell wall biosynthesis
LKILSLTDLSSIGGASIAGNRITETLKANGAVVVQLSSDGKISKEKRVLLNGKKFTSLDNLFSPLISERIAKSLRENNINHQFRKFLQRERFDAVNIHNLHCAGWPISLVNTALEFAPVAWTLHDCWSFLGCFHSSHCPSPSNSFKNRLNEFWTSFELTKPRHSLTAATPSEWIKNQAASSYWNDYVVKTIRNPVPKSFFELLDRESCKKALDLSLEKPIILCIAGNLNNEMKGGAILQEILNSDAKDNCQFLLIGEENELKNSESRSLGFIMDELTLRIAYNAADLLLHPAQIDNLPNTVAEAMSAGTPVLAFQTGGLPEMVVSGKSGWLVPEINAQLMIHELHSIIKLKTYKNLRNSTQELARQLFDPKKIGEQYMNLFQGLVS